jgi:hypothetical protein
MLVALAIVACALAGCGTSTSDQVKAKVAQFAQAVRAKDAGTLCNQVLAPNLLERLPLGLPCVKAMQVFVGSVHDPTLAVGRVVITGKTTAEAITLSGARGQIGSLSAVQLVNTANGWRVSGLGSPLIPGLVHKKK